MKKRIIEPIIKQNIKQDTKYFIKLSGTSGKNEKSIRSFTNEYDIISHLVSVKLLLFSNFSGLEYTKILKNEDI